MTIKADARISEKLRELFDPEPHHERLLDQLDRIEEEMILTREVLNDHGMILKSSQGDRLNPAAAHLVALRNDYRRTLVALDLPEADEDGDELAAARARKANARKAARSRWGGA